MEYGLYGLHKGTGVDPDGLCQDVTDAPRVLLSPRNPAVATDLARRFGTVVVAKDNQAVVDGAQAVLVCVRPHLAHAVLTELRFPADRIVISAMAGVPVAALRRHVAPAADVVRVIPLPSVAAREGLIALHPPDPAVRALFDRLGARLEISDEAAFEALSASTATIAAHYAYLGAVAGWLESRGIPADAATRYVAEMFTGLSTATRRDDDFEQLALEHATPGGINEQFLADLDQSDTAGRIGTALQRVLLRLTEPPASGKPLQR